MKKTIAAATVAAALGLSASAHAFNVDLFEETQTVQVEAPNNGVSDDDFVTEAVAGNIMGQERDIQVTLVDGTGATPGNRVRMTVFDGKLSFSNDDGIKGQGVVQWDGIDGSMALNPTGLGGLDLWQFGAGFIVQTLSADLGFPIAINAYTDATTFTEVEIATTGPGVEFISFAALEDSTLCGTSFGPILSVTCGSSGNVDMSNFGALEFIINIDGATAAVDLSIGPITVPEPATLSLLGLGLAGAGFLGTRRRKQKLAA